MSEPIWLTAPQAIVFAARGLERALALPDISPTEDQVDALVAVVVQRAVTYGYGPELPFAGREKQIAAQSAAPFYLAVQELVKRGRTPARGRATPNGPFEMIDRGEFQDLQIVGLHARSTVSGTIRWYSLQIACWEPQPAAAPAPADVVHRPKQTDKAVREWFRERVRSWPLDQPAPSESDDIDAVQKAYSGLGRDEIRNIRKAETPGEWRKQGKRRPWGIARKSAANSANPPAA
jgi:hypothetical protein